MYRTQSLLAALPAVVLFLAFLAMALGVSDVADHVTTTGAWMARP